MKYVAVVAVWFAIAMLLGLSRLAGWHPGGLVMLGLFLAGVTFSGMILKKKPAIT